MTCCQDLERVRAVASPFNKVIALGWYDGPIEGFAQCAACGRGFHFDLGAWDDTRRARIYELHTLPEGAFAAAASVLAALGPARWPMWVPHWDTPASKQLSAIDTDLTRIRDSASTDGLVIASSDLLGEIAAARRCSSALSRLLPRSKGEDGVFGEWAAVVDG